MSKRITAVALLLTFFAGHLASAATPTFIESPDGKRLVAMDDPALDQAFQEVSVDGKTVLYIHENQILKDPKESPILVIDDRMVRHSLGGLALANFDGDNLRHARDPNGKILINYHHPDLCPDAASDRVYRVNGPELNKTQLVAALYALKPELFTLSDDEIAAQNKARADAAAEEDRLAKMDQVAKPWMVLNGHGPVEKINQGTITFTPKQGDVYPVTFDYTKDGGPTWTGIADSHELSGDRYIWAAYGTPKTIGLAVYKIDGGKLSGVWHPWYGGADPKNLGTEELQGPDTLDGDFQIVSAKAPSTGAAYNGTVTIKPLTIVGADDEEKPYSLTWTIGTVKVQGIGIRTKDFLYVASGSGADVNIGKFKMENGNATFSGDFFKLGATDMGGLAATD